jgi:uncharacterized protein YgbK (DUF1537 family)
MLLLGGIVDDLTGAVELAGMLAAGGARVALTVGEAEPVAPQGEEDAIIVALQSRAAPVEQARAAVAQAADALLGAGARQLFFKYCATFDSTPLGNIGPCADTLMERTGADFTLFAPSFPEADRTVYRGHLFVGDQLVSNSPKRLDPLTPMTEPDLVRVLQAQTPRRVGLLPLPVVAAGPEATARRVAELRAQGIAYAISDALEEAHLACLAETSADWPLATGNSNLASHYPAIWRARGLLRHDASPALPPRGGHAAVLAGSCADRTREQVEHFGRSHPVLRFDPACDISVEAALDWAVPRLREGPVCITTAGDPASVEAAQRAFGRDGAARRAEALLGGVARGLVAAGVRRLLVAGGETSGAVVRALGVGRLAVAPYEAAGIGLCSAEASVPLALCLKSGKLGPVDMFVRVLERMRG